MQQPHTLAIMLSLVLIAPAQTQNKCMFEKHKPITLEGGKYKPIRFGNTQRDFIFQGEFDAHGSKISVYITDTENYALLINGKKFEPIYAANKVKGGWFYKTLDKGNYYLVWWNESVDKTAVIEAEVCFVHPEE